jgi:uncharacterized protein YvpB
MADKRKAGEVIAIFLVGLAGIAVIVLGFVLNSNPRLLSGILMAQPAVVELPKITPGPSNTPFQPIPTNPRVVLAAALPTAAPTETPTPLPPTEAPPPPAPAWPPASASISNIVGYPQGYALSCESRSAVDWARYFSVEIGETEFLTRLPLSDNPEVGFVGSYYDYGGMVPPYSYGVHAEPVAKLLREYGLPASGLKGLSLAELRAEIASGRPVIVWVIFGVSNGYALDYTASDGQSMQVAPNEHTVIVIGYDESSITVLDGARAYSRSIEQFERSWEVLGNMAVIYQPPAN